VATETDNTATTAKAATEKSVFRPKATKRQMVTEGNNENKRAKTNELVQVKQEKQDPQLYSNQFRPLNCPDDAITVPDDIIYFISIQLHSH
jgi:hypothetical protein